MSLVAQQYIGGASTSKTKIVKVVLPVGDGGVERVNFAMATRCHSALLDINLTWNAFIKNHWPKDAEAPEDILLATVESMFGIPHANIHTVQSIIDELCLLGRSNPTRFVESFAQRIKLHNVVAEAVRHTFTSWRIMLETLVKKHVVGVIGQAKFDDIIAQWRRFDIKHNIQSSSLILMAISPPAKPTDLPWLTGAKWLQTPPPRLSTGPKAKALASALTKWHYLGFCPHRAIQRLKLLLEFPTHELLWAIGGEDRGGRKGRPAHGKHEGHGKHVVHPMPAKEFAELQLSALPDSPNETIMPIMIECRSSDKDTPQQALRRSVDNFLAIINSLEEHLLTRETYYVQIGELLVQMNNAVVAGLWQ